MKTPDRLLIHRSLSEAAMDTLDALHQHRLLTTSQVREMILAGRTLRRTQQVLAELVSRQLVEWVAALVRGRARLSESGSSPNAAERS